MYKYSVVMYIPKWFMDTDNHRRMNLFKTGVRLLEIARNSCLYGGNYNPMECQIKLGGFNPYPLDSMPMLMIINVTGPEKTGLIYVKYICSYYGTYLKFWLCYSQSVNFIEFHIDFCMHDKACVIIQNTIKKLL